MDKEKLKEAAKKVKIERGTPRDAAMAIQAIVLCGWVIIAIVMKAMDLQDKTVLVLVGYYAVVALIAVIETVIRKGLKKEEEES